MAFIEVEDLTKQYGTTKALSSVNLTVDRGDFLTVVGPSGSGKTTLLRLLDMLEKPSRGRILIEGIDAEQMDERLRLRRRLGMVFQHNVMLNTTVYENVVYPLKVRGLGSDLRQKSAKALERVGLSGYAQKKAITLSGGETQRVSLAQALIFEPEVLLLDEPTANLDPRNSSIIEGIVSQVNREDEVTVIMSTHNITQAQRFASKLLILRGGEMAGFDDASKIFSKPSSFLATFTEMWNVYQGIATPLEDSLASIYLGNDVKLQASTRKTGKVTVFVSPDEIIVTSASTPSSARNMLKGKIAEIVDLGERVQLDVDCGMHVTARITKRSFREMGLNLESEIFLNFKASSVKITQHIDDLE